MNGNNALLLTYGLAVGLCSLLFFTSCNDRVIGEFKITNHTLHRIDSLAIEPNRDLTSKYISLEPGETFIYKADMTDIPKVDGSYLLSYRLNKTNVHKGFGYFTNGYPLGTVLSIEIQSDSTIITESNY